MIEGTKDGQSVDRYWQPVGAPEIHDVEVRAIQNVLKDAGHLTEVYRRDWSLGPDVVGQVFQVSLPPGAVSAWHTHRGTWDRLCCTIGTVKIALFDARPGSPTEGVVQVVRLGELRPAVVLVPPAVWHGVQNIGTTPAALLNVVDVAYDYEDPDHWRVPADTDEIPFSWG